MDIHQIDSDKYSQLRNTHFFHNGPYFIVEADIHIDGDKICLNQRLEIIPVLSGDSEHMELPLILVNGHERHRAYKQMCSGMGQQKIEKVYRIYKEIKTGKDLRCRYRQQISYAEWMESAALLLQER